MNTSQDSGIQKPLTVAQARAILESRGYVIEQFLREDGKEVVRGNKNGEFVFSAATNNWLTSWQGAVRIMCSLEDLAYYA